MVLVHVTNTVESKGLNMLNPAHNAIDNQCLKFDEHMIGIWQITMAGKTTTL
jgi:hypothetical protein